MQRLVERVPSDYVNRTYREPFLGAGSLFFALTPERAVLSDSNGALIGCFAAVRDQPLLISRYLAGHLALASEQHFYRERVLFNASKRFSPAQAARFIFLNKTCFNGLYRVNRQGAFNVPYGWKEPPSLPTRSQLLDASSSLSGAVLKAVDYREALKAAKKGDFIYLDPPYPAMDGSECFNRYTSDRFSADNQSELANECRRLDRLGCLVMMSNADTPTIRSLYKHFRLAVVPAHRCLTCKAVRLKVNELVITNYGPVS